MKIGLALGGGGVRGLAHLSALQVLEEEGIRPVAIAGTSMGALIGAFFARGMSAEEIWTRVDAHLVLGDQPFREIREKRKTLFHWLRFFRLVHRPGALLSADGFLDYLRDGLGATTFEELDLPFHVVATDFHAMEKVVFSSGPLLPALKASMAIPGVFEPVVFEGRVLVDGGISDNLPWQALSDRCDAVIAIDVPPSRGTKSDKIPGPVDLFVECFEALIAQGTRRRLEEDPPALYFQPDLRGVRTLDINKVEDVLEQAAEEMERFRGEVRRLRESL